MKKQKTYFMVALFAVVVFFVNAILVYAADPVFNCTGSGCGTDGGLKTLFKNLTGTGLIQSDDIIAVILGWTRFLLALLGVLAFAAFVWAGFLYITAFAGGDENAETAKKTMIWTAIGIIVILTSYAIVSTLIRATV
jgi:hypothetical protein